MVTPRSLVEYITSRGSQLGKCSWGRKSNFLEKLKGMTLVDLHLVSDGEVCQVSQLVLEDGLISWEGKARYFIEVRRSNDLRGGNKNCLQVNSLKHT